MVNGTSIYEEISSSDEEPILNEQFSELLLTLEKDLQKLKEDSGEDLNDHFKDLEELKKTATLSVINIENITWFLETAIFDLMSEFPKKFSIKPLALYERMLKMIESFPKDSDFLEHKNTLLDLKNEENDKLFSLIKKKKDSKVDSLLERKLQKEIERRKKNSVQSFFHALNARKRSLEECSSESNAIPSIKRIKLPTKISPLALPNSSSSKQISDECHENLLRPGMKLI